MECTQNIWDLVIIEGADRTDLKDHPLFLPDVKSFGMDPIHFGLIFVYNLCIGNITPPVGNTLFVAIKVGGSTLAKTILYMIWYYVAILIGSMLIPYVPFFSMGLPMMAGLA